MCKCTQKVLRAKALAANIIHLFGRAGINYDILGCFFRIYNYICIRTPRYVVPRRRIYAVCRAVHLIYERRRLTLYFLAIRNYHF